MPQRTRSIPPHQYQITSEEMFRGIYIDYEGSPNQSPALLGILCEGHFEQVVLRKELISTISGNPDLRFKELLSALLDLQNKASTEGRFIFAYSQYESRVSDKYAGVDLSLLYKDVRKIARRWKNQKLELNDPSIRSLKDYVQLLGLVYPEDMLHQAARRLQNVEKYIKTHGDFLSCPPEVRQQWCRLLEYNRLDCVWMQQLVSAAVGKSF